MIPLMRHTDRYQLLQLRLGRDLGTYIADARSSGRSLRQVAADLRTITGMPVTYESVRKWEPTPETGDAA